MSRNTPWLDIIGIGEDGLDGLSSIPRQLIAEAEILIGAERHQSLVKQSKVKRILWPSPFDLMIDQIKSYRDHKTVVLVTGDPLWFSVGTHLIQSLPSDEIRVHPQVSAFQWAACRMGWSMSECETLTIHGRAVEQLIVYFSPAARLLVLSKDASSPQMVANLLVKHGFGSSRICAMSHLGGHKEQKFEGRADSWNHDVPDFHSLAIECIADQNAVVLPNGPGLPDNAFVHDGKMTKSEIRTITLSKLSPQRGDLLWDIGLGCGSVAIEWLRYGKNTRAIGLEPQAKRREMALQNALNLGTPTLDIQGQEAPEGLINLPAPNAVFIGGGLSEESFQLAWSALKPYGRLVANAVTLKSEALLLKLHREYGGELIRLSVARAEPVGPYHGWKPLMPVTQFCLVKRGGA